MSDNRGVFGLSGYYDKEVSGDIPERTRESFREYGYFGGGYAPGTRSTVDRLDYSNDTQTASVRGPLTISRYWLSGVGNQNFGYFGGGLTPLDSSRIDRIDFSNDNIIASTRGPLTGAKFALASAGNNNFGYFAGGRQEVGPTYSTIERIEYSNDLVSAALRGSLSIAKRGVSASGNSNFGYFSGGFFVSTVERINYSNDTSATSVRGPLSSSRSYHAATGNINFGYAITAYPTFISSYDRINYSNDTATAVQRGVLASAGYTKAATGNSNFGYTGGASGPRSSVNRIDYSNDTVIASLRGPLSSARVGASATSSASFGGSPISQYGVFAKPFGYFGGGSTGSNLSTIDRIDYSNDTGTATIRNTLTANKRNCGGTGNSNFGYFGGGVPGLISTVDRIDYSSDVSTVLTRGTLSLARNYLGASGNSNFGYFGGGANPSIPASYSTIDRISYSNDTTTASVRGSLTIAKIGSTATGTSNFGYFGGGNPGGAGSNIDRIDYSNDTQNTTTRNTLTFSSIYSSASGNQNFGYFAGGAPTISTTNRIDYSSDTSTISTRGPLSLARYNSYAVSTTNFGYYGGGGQLSPFVPYSTIDRIDYANDTATASVRGPLSSAKYVGAAVSPTSFGGATDFQPTSTFFDIQSMRRIEDTTNYSVKKRALGSFGYFVGGSVTGGTTLSTTNRIDYANDTATASVRGLLSIARRSTGGAGNSNFGYHGGGFIPSPLFYSTVDRIDYSNDSSNTSIRTPLLANGYHSGFGNQIYGYFASSQGLTTISRIDFSNDTSILLRNIMQRSAYYRAATGNNNYGYIQEGANTSVSPIVTTSLVERVQYSNDTQKTLIRGPLSIARRSSGATGNSNFGYYAAGINGSIPAVYSTIDRIDYSNDTATASVRGPLLSVASGINEGTGNSNFGYFSGFAFPSGGSSGSGVNRVNYSNDTATASARGPLSSTRYSAGASTNARFS